MSRRKIQKSAVSAPFEQALADLVLWLDQISGRGLVIGGVAASLLGRPRLTQDIDLLVLIDESQWKEFLKVGLRFGFEPRISDALAFARKNRVLLMRHTKSGLDIDVSFGSLPFEEEALKRSSKVRVGDMSIPLPTPEDLIVMKAVAHRPKDLMDIEAILEANPKLDRKRVLKWVKAFAEAVEMPEILNDLEKLMKKSKKTKHF